MLAIKQQSAQSITVTVRDTTGLVSDLSSAHPTFDIYAVDPTTDANGSKIVERASATATGLAVNCTITPEYTYDVAGVPGSGIAQAAPSFSLPLTVTTGVNDKFNIPSIFFGSQIVPAGTYSTYSAVSDAMNSALGQFTLGVPYYYAIGDELGLFSYDVNLAKYRFDGLSSSFPSTVGTDEALNGLTIANGGARDFLAGTGWKDGQILFEGAISAWNIDVNATNMDLAQYPLVPGRYRLYVSFETLHAQIPRIGPVEFFVY